MRLIVWLIPMCLLGSGCGALNRMSVKWPGKGPSPSERMAFDTKRREATEKFATQTGPDRTAQQSNFGPAINPARSSVDSLLADAKQAELAGQNTNARSLFEQVLRQQPNNAEAHHRLGVLADKERNYSEAHHHYQMALSQDPQNGLLLSDMGYSYFSQNRLDEAEHYLNSALELQPNNQYARNNLAQVRAMRSQPGGQSGVPNQGLPPQFAQSNNPQTPYGVEPPILNPTQQTSFETTQTATPPADEESRVSRLNPFKKLVGKNRPNASRPGNNLEAPAPVYDKATQKFVDDMARIRKEMEARGEIRPRSQIADNNPNSGRQSANAVGNDQLREELSRIDHEAALRMQAIRGSQPDLQPGMNRYPQGPNSSTGIEPASNWEYSNNGPGSQGFRTNPASPNGEFAAGGPAHRNWNNPGATGATGGAGEFRGDEQWGQAGPVQQGPGMNPQGPVRDPFMDPAEGPSQQTNWSPSWPDSSGSGNQYNARGESWDGHSIIQDNGDLTGGPGAPGGNPAWNGGPQRPGLAPGREMPPPGTGPGGRGRFAPGSHASYGSSPEWGPDNGRQAAAQLGLDAGMGDIFPGSDSSEGYSNSQYQQDGGPWQQNGPAHRQGPDGQFGSQGMPPGGAGMMNPTDYHSQPPSFQQGGYSRGAVPSMGGNQGGQNASANAPWNSPSSGNSYNGSAGQYRGRFAPDTSQGAPENFGAPPMYFGR